MIFSFLLFKDTLWLVFLLSSILTLFLASKTVKYFTLFSTRANMSSSSLAGIFLALITSMPELINGILGGVNNSSTLVYSNVLGANTILIFFFAIFSLIFGNKARHQLPSRSLKIILGSTLISIILFSSLFFAKEATVVTIGNSSFSIVTFIQFILYVAFIIFLVKNKDSIEEEPTQEIRTKIKSKNKILGVFVLYAALLILSAVLLNNVVQRMGEATNVGGYGLGASLVGALFLSFVTTLPEIVSMFKLFRLGMINVAVSAGIGSHFFNFTILFLSDVINQNPVLLSVYQNEYKQQLFIWIIYISTYFLLLNQIYNKWMKRRKHLFTFGVLNMPIVYVTLWTIHGVT